MNSIVYFSNFSLKKKTCNFFDDKEMKHLKKIDLV